MRHTLNFLEYVAHVIIEEIKYKQTIDSRTYENWHYNWHEE